VLVVGEDQLRHRQRQVLGFFVLGQLAAVGHPLGYEPLVVLVALGGAVEAEIKVPPVAAVFRDAVHRELRHACGPPAVPHSVKAVGRLFTILGD
jgi:hypothetical protein